MKKLKKQRAFAQLALTALLGTCGIGTSHAVDVVTNVGDLAGYLNDLYISSVIQHPTTGESFNDYFNFTTSLTGGVSSAVSITLSSVLNMSSFAVSLYSGNATVSGGVSSCVSCTLVVGPVGSNVTISSALTPFANYTLLVSGTTSGSLGGAYFSSIQAVPETDTWAMMVAGLGLVGLRLRKRMEGSRQIRA